MKGGATEDVHLYRKFLHSSLMVVRAPSRGLFHVWHPTVCHAHLSRETFKLCLQDKALNQASHSQLGQIIFHQQINNHLHTYKQHNIKSWGTELTIIQRQWWNMNLYWDCLSWRTLISSIELLYSRNSICFIISFLNLSLEWNRIIYISVNRTKSINIYIC